MASSYSGSQDAGTGAQAQGERVGLKIPFFRWGHRRYYFFIGFRVRKHQHSFTWPSAAELQRLASQQPLPSVAGGETQPMMLMMAQDSASNAGGAKDSTGSSTGVDATYSFELGAGSDTSFGMMPPDDPPPKNIPPPT